MEKFRAIMSVIVMIIGFTGWMALLPQAKLLVKVKKSDSISISLYWIGTGMQATVLTYLLIQPTIDWKLSLCYITCLICQIIVLRLIYYYRKYPSGRRKQKPS